MSLDAFYALLLLAYPRRFRARFAGPMKQIFSDRCRAARAQGRRALVRLVARSLIDVALTATAERASATADWLLDPTAYAHLSVRELQGRRPMPWHSMSMDVRHALRLFARTPLFTALTLFALALGIGANSAIFSVVNGVLLKPLPYAAPEQLVMIWSDNTRESRPQYPMSPANFLDYKAAARRVRGVEAMFSFISGATIRTPAGAEQVTASFVTPGMFALLGRTAALGRALVPSDTGALVLSDGFWTRRFGRDPTIVGRQLTFNEQPFTVVGVMPRDFIFPYTGMLGPAGSSSKTEADVWAALDPTSRTSQFVDANGRFVRSVHLLSVVARLVPGATLVQAHEEALAIAARLERSFPDSNTGLRANVVSLHEQAVGKIRPALMLLAAGVGFVLLLACVNVANLLLARGMARQREMAVRTALGAGRVRLLRQTLTETLLLSGAGAIVGLVLVRWATQAFTALAPRDIPRLQEIAPDWRVVAFTAGVAICTGVLIGLVPAFAASRPESGRLKDASRGLVSASGRRTRSALIAAEVALAVVLTIGAGLLVRSFTALLAVDPGFRSEGLLTLQITLPARIATADARRAFYHGLFATLESLPGVGRVGGTTRLPLGSTNLTTRVAVEGRRNTPDEMPEVSFRRALHDYFPAMGVPLLRGRTLGPDDGPNAPPVVVINQALARRLFGTDEPVGKHVKLGSDPATPWSTVGGVVGNIHHSGLDEPPAPEIYLSSLTTPPVAPFIVMRTTTDPAAVAETVRAALRRLDKDLAAYDVRTMMQIRSASVSERRFIVILAAIFGLIAVTLAVVGVYGVMALVVTERTREMGVRLALGAAPRQVLLLVVRQGVAVAGAGIAIGIAASTVLTPLMANQLFGVAPTDPATMAAAPALLLAVALMACVVPARRAMGVDPVIALRDE